MINVKVKVLNFAGIRVTQIADRARACGAVSVHVEDSQFLASLQYVDLIATFNEAKHADAFMQANITAGCLSKFGQVKKVFDNVKQRE